MKTDVGEPGHRRLLCGGLMRWTPFKWSLAIAVCSWALYAIFLVFTRYPCGRSSPCWAPLLTRINGSYHIHPSDCGANSTAVEARPPTGLDHVVFGIAASADEWKQRKEYVDLWWQPGRTRGFVWFDRPPDGKWSSSSPPFRVSQNTSSFKYTHKKGSRSAIRISRIVSETFRLRLPGVRWFVMGDDDTVFFTENLVRVLSKYDHRQYYYIGSNSECTAQNRAHSYGMAFGGAGFAISYPLAEALEKMQDRCLRRYPHLYGSDHRIQACLAELGVPLTREPGFHQVDFRGHIFGLLAAHPTTPLISLHHVDAVASIFPGMLRIEALRHLMQAARADSNRLLQQSICYDRRHRWTVSVSWGYAVQLFHRIELPSVLEYPLLTFETWKTSKGMPSFQFNTRLVPKNPCQRPTVFFMETTAAESPHNIVSNYTKHVRFLFKDKCNVSRHSVDGPQRITISSSLLQTDWKSQAPRRQCCQILPSSKSSEMEIKIRSCRDGEFASPP